MKLECAIITLFCYIAVDVESAKFITPKIIQDKDVVVNTGDNLILTCEGMEPLTWTIVNYKKNNYDKASIITSIKNAENSKFPYGSILRIENVTYLNSGFFYCHALKSSKDDPVRSTKIYVYVRDENRLSILPSEELAVILGKPKTEVIVPCLRTSPDIRVVLISSYGDQVDPHESNFDPRLGFKIRMVDEKQVVYCVFTRKNQNETIKIFLSTFGTSKIETSYVYQSRGNNIPYVGGELKLICNIIVPHNTFYIFEWMKSDLANGTTIIKNNRVSIKKDPLITIMTNGKLLSSSLIINNVTKEDAGQYYCVISTHSGERHAHIYVTVLDADRKIEQPKINYTGSEILLQAQDNLTLVCEGSESVNWYIDDLYKFDNNVYITMYEESKDIHKAILTISNASIKDAGSFVCRPEHVRNDDPTRTNKIFVYVQDKRELSKYVGNYGKTKTVALNTISNIPCIPSSPDVTVNLIDSNGNNVPSEKASFFPKLGFNFKATDIGLRPYKCLYQRGNITQELRINILVFHNPEYDKISAIDAPEKAISGQDVQLNCSMIIYDAMIYNQRQLFINWTVPDLLMPENIVIDEEVSYALASGKVLVRGITVKDIDFRAEGDYVCTLYDSMLNQVNSLSKYITVEEQIDAELTIRVPERKYFVIGEDLILNCSAKSNYNERFTLHWSYNNKAIINSMRINQTILEMYGDINGLVGSTLLVIKNVTLADGGIYRCIMKNDVNATKHIDEKIIIHEPESPVIFETNMNNTEWKMAEGENIDLHCKSTGIPVPTIIWRKNDNPWIIDSNQNRIILQDNNTTVKFLYTQKDDTGKYTCLVSNVAGEEESTILLTVLTDAAGWTLTQIIFIIILLILLSVLVVVLILKVIKEKKRKKEFKVAGLNQFEQGAIENINPNLGVDSQADLLPYNNAFEIPRDKLKLGKQLGSGFFGVVIQAEAIGIFRDEHKKIVAIKKVKSGADYIHIKALLSELKIMIHLGKHLNVVNLLGACTKNISKRELLVVVEYCCYGNIQNFLLKQRNNFINQIDRSTDTINISIGEDVLKHFTQKKSTEICYYNVLQQNANYSNIITHTDILQNQNKYDNEMKPTCTNDLFCWAFQISRGMEYLSSRNVLHGDLAARNILLTDDNVVKICDFGLAKNMYKNSHYKKKTDGPLPVKWMAPESIVDRVFSTQSDVWSFGIVLWELFSLARTPYPEMEVDKGFYDKLLSGNRMTQPEYSTNAMYQIMLCCWQTLPSNRPLFCTLSEKIGALLAENVQKYYIELNLPYENLNVLQFTNQSDFLGMMRQPDYNNLRKSPNIYVNVTNDGRNNSSINTISPLNENNEMIVHYSTLDLQSNTSEEDNSEGGIAQEKHNHSMLQPSIIKKTTDSVKTRNNQHEQA